MKNIMIALVMLASTTAFASTSTTYLCYKGCTFDGYRNAQEYCEIAAQGFRSGSNDVVHMSASCYKDESEICGKISPFCSFGSVVLQRDITVLK